MSSDNHNVLSTSKRSDNTNSNYNNNDRTLSAQCDTTVLALPRNVVNNTDDFISLRQQSQQNLSDGVAKIGQATPTEISAIAAATTTETASSTNLHLQMVQQQQQQQQQHVIQYPAEFMQQGKRKFQNLESDRSKDNFQNSPYSNNTTSHQSNHSNADNEAGLSLLFAASLLQQQEQQQNYQVSKNNIDGNGNADKVNSTPIIMNTETVLNWGPPLPLPHHHHHHHHQEQPQQHHQIVRSAYPTYSIRSIIDERKNDVQMILKDAEVIDNIEDGTLIEPRANDGTFIWSAVLRCITFDHFSCIFHISISFLLVLCGRGGGINKHYGNIVYRRVVEYNKRVYKQVPKRHRMLVSRSIVQAIINAGGRFLQQQEELEQTASNNTSSTHNIGDPIDDAKPMKQCRWTPIQVRRAVQKTSQALRERSCSGNTSNDDDEPESLSVQN